MTCVSNTIDLTNNDDLPLVSIVTPSFNQGAFIDETIKSVLTQKYPNIEYVVVDAESSDNTLDVLKSYNSDSRFRFVCEKDSGQADAINKGWSMCKGEIVSWLCSDDVYCDPLLFDQVIRIFQEHKNISVVHGRSIFIDEGGSYKYTTSLKEMNLDALMKGINPIYQPSTFIRRSAVDSIGQLRTDLNYLMDFEYWLRLATNGHEFMASDMVMSKYRVWANSKTSLSTGKFDQELVQILQMYGSPHVERVKRQFEIKNKFGFLMKIKHDYEWKFPIIRKILDQLRLN
jgi:glycosyltransferase involved in cell wall biosynthesis